MSRGARETPRQEPDRSRSEQETNDAAKLKQQFRDAAAAVTAEAPLPAKRSRRRSEGDGLVGLRMSAFQIVRRPEVSLPKDVRVRSLTETWSAEAGRYTRNRASVAGPREEASTGGELINWYLSLGYRIEVIRAMFPGLFTDSLAKQDHWSDSLDCFNPYWTPSEAYGAFDHHSFSAWQ